jgi:hypothetical protein
VKFFTRKGSGNVRKHFFLSMNLTQHDYYGKLIADERSKTERRSHTKPRRP